jgi:hypothetical protein
MPFAADKIFRMLETLLELNVVFSPSLSKNFKVRTLELETWSKLESLKQL